MPGVDRTRQSGGWLVAVGFSNLCWSIAAITLTASCVENSCVVDGDCVDGGVCDTVNGGFCVTRPDGGEVVGVDAGFDAGPPPLPVCTPKCLDWQSCEVGSTKKLAGHKHKAEARNAVSAAIRYIRKRKKKMRYARFYKANLPIGSGATESTCWQMQQRVKKPAQSWEPDGLRGVLAMRSLCLSDRWDTAWQPFAAQHRPEVTVLA